MRPRQVADLYRPWLDGQLGTADTSRNRLIAQTLVRTRHPSLIKSSTGPAAVLNP